VLDVFQAEYVEAHPGDPAAEAGTAVAEARVRARSAVVLVMPVSSRSSTADCTCQTCDFCALILIKALIPAATRQRR
jgi:hypothetical protein